VPWHTRDMAEIDELARRAVALLQLLAQRGAQLAFVVAMFVGAAGLVTFLLGLAAFEGGARSAWVAIGIALVLVAVGAPLLAGWRLSAVRRDATSLLTDVRTLLARNADAERVVIETVEQSDLVGARSPAVVVHSRRFANLRSIAGTANDLRSLPSAMLAVTTFPALLAVGLVFLPVFFILGFVFLIAWIA